MGEAVGRAVGEGWHTNTIYNYKTSVTLYGFGYVTMHQLSSSKNVILNLLFKY